MLTAGHLMLALGALGSAAAVGVRAATSQFGYLVGAAVGGAALAAGGYKVLVVSLAARFALGTVPHLTAILSQTVFAPLSGDSKASAMRDECRVSR